MSSKLTIYACILLGALIGPWAQAQDAGAYPNRPIKLIVTVPPGGAADFIARLLASKLSAQMPMIKPSKLKVIDVPSKKNSIQNGCAIRKGTNSVAVAKIIKPRKIDLTLAAPT